MIKQLNPAKTIEQLGDEILLALEGESMLVSFQALKKAELELMAQLIDAVTGENTT